MAKQIGADRLGRFNNFRPSVYLYIPLNIVIYKTMLQYPYCDD